MCDIRQALGWLNKRRPSNLTRFYAQVVDDLYFTGNTEAERVRAFERLQNNAPPAFRPEEKPEIQIHIGIFYFERNQCTKAAEQFSAAVDLYRWLNDEHRRGVALWMHHLALRGDGLLEEAFRTGREARSCFLAEMHEATRLGQTDLAGWYRNVIVNMTAHFLRSPYDTVGWLNEFHGTHIVVPAAVAQKRIRTLRSQRSFEEARSQMKVLIRLLQGADNEALAEALAFCGATCALIDGDPASAIDYLRRARAKCDKDDHDRLLVTWMLGLTELRDPDRCERGLMDLQESLRETRQQALNQDHRNDQPRREWYELHAAAMEQVLEELAESNL